MKPKFFKQTVSIILAAVLALGMFIVPAGAAPAMSSTDLVYVVGKTDESVYKREDITVGKQIKVSYDIYLQTEPTGIIGTLGALSYYIKDVPGAVKIDNYAVEDPSNKVQTWYTPIGTGADGGVHSFRDANDESKRFYDWNKTTGFFATISANYMVTNPTLFLGQLPQGANEMELPILNESVGIATVYYDGNDIQQENSANVKVYNPTMKFNAIYKIKYNETEMAKNTNNVGTITLEEEWKEGDPPYQIPTSYNGLGYTDSAGKKWILKEWEKKEGSTITRIGRGSTFTPSADVELKPIYTEKGIIGPRDEEIQATYKVRNTTWGSTRYDDRLGVQSLNLNNVTPDYAELNTTDWSVVVAIPKVNATDTTAAIGTRTVSVNTKTDWTQHTNWYSDQDGTAIANIATHLVNANNTNPDREKDDNVIYIYLKKGNDPVIDDRMRGPVTVTYDGAPYNNGQVVGSPVLDVPVNAPFDVYVDGNTTPIKSGNATPDVTDPKNPTGAISLLKTEIPEKNADRHPITEIKAEKIPDPADPTNPDKDRIKITVKYDDKVPKSNLDPSREISNDTVPGGPTPWNPGDPLIPVETGAYIVFVKGGTGIGSDPAVNGKLFDAAPVIKIVDPTTTIATNQYPDPGNDGKTPPSPFKEWKLEGDKTKNSAFKDPNPYLPDSHPQKNEPFYVMRATYKDMAELIVNSGGDEDPVIGDNNGGGEAVPVDTVVKVMTAMDDDDPANRDKPIIDSRTNQPAEYKVPAGKSTWTIPDTVDANVSPRKGDQFFNGNYEPDRENNGELKYYDNGKTIVVRPAYRDPKPQEIKIVPIDPRDPENPGGPVTEENGGLISGSTDGYIVLAGKYNYGPKYVAAKEKTARAYYKVSVTANGKSVAAVANDVSKLSALDTKVHGFDKNDFFTKEQTGTLAANFVYDATASAGKDYGVFYVDYSMEKSSIIKIAASAEYNGVKGDTEGNFYIIMVGNADKLSRINAEDVTQLSLYIRGTKPAKAIADPNTEFKWEIADCDKSGTINAEDITAASLMIRNNNLTNN